MTKNSPLCPICGAKIIDHNGYDDFTCSFCAFEQKTKSAPGNIPSEFHHDSIPYDCSLPFQKDLNTYFRDKFDQLKAGDLWYLSTPVTRPFQTTSPLVGQINFFHAKNIMFLLEQHGFKMAWRKNRFSTSLKIIARRN